MRKLLGGATVDNIEIETGQDRDPNKTGFLLEPHPNRVFFFGGANSGQWTRILTWGVFFEKPSFALESRFSIVLSIEFDDDHLMKKTNTGWSGFVSMVY